MIQWWFNQNCRRKNCGDIFVNSNNISMVVIKKKHHWNCKSMMVLGEPSLKSVWKWGVLAFESHALLEFHSISLRLCRTQKCISVGAAQHRHRSCLVLLSKLLFTKNPLFGYLFFPTIFLSFFFFLFFPLTTTAKMHHFARTVSPST